MKTAKELIDFLGLQPLPGEGGYYKETHRSEVGFPGTNKHASTAIYYLLTPSCTSILHRLPTEEIYHFYGGTPVELVLVSPTFEISRVTLGSDLLAGQIVQYRVPANYWQGSYLAGQGDYALMGTTMSPGFEFSDFEAASKSDFQSEIESGKLDRRLFV